ncbi:TonB-dependent receptor [Dokdonella sp.]|uniref:TonB-dependent receptor domain-containing protein n=1 Tax=Dokdonella sp. TaxID=2291710 RepID=UPI001B0DB01E|nr:TonB-dependent receptor [Dokdonella sp.]MBO9664313.1 TonB-dependent receptor [Dokdonella sp.]
MLQRSMLFLALSGALCANARADDEQLQPTVQVTASRVAETVDSTLADVSVITREDIDASVARDAIDLLRLQAGVDLYRTGGAGQQTSLFLRGTNSNQVLVLIDGVRVSSQNTGAFAFEQLPLDTVERIEIVRGPRASYWGSDAIGGVIQIFTRKLDGPRVALGYGSYRDADGSAGFGHWDGANGYSVQVGARHVGGFSVTNRRICNGPDDPYCIFNPDDDGYRNTNFAGRAAHQFGSQVLSASLYRSQGQTQFDQGYSDVIEQSGGINLEGALGENWNHRLAFGNSREDLDTPAFTTLYHTRRNSLLWQNEFRLGEQQRLIAGIDFVREKGETIDTFSHTRTYGRERDNRAVFAGWRGDFGALDSELSLRRDDNDDFGGATTGSLALGWRFSPLLRVYANVGRGFRAPTMNELYHPGYGGWFAGNPDLDAERSRSTELGVEFTPDANQRIKANLYTTRVKDLISFTGPQSRAENIAKADIDGAEIEYQLKLDAWSLRANYTWMDARNGDTDQQLLRRPKQKFTGVVERSFGERWRAGAELVYAGRRHDTFGGNTIDLSSYAIVNLRAGLTLNRDWSLAARVENLTDRDYELVRGYNTAGRSGFLEVIWQPRP